MGGIRGHLQPTWRRRIRYFTGTLCRKLFFPLGVTDLLQTDEWLAGTHYTAARKIELKKVEERLCGKFPAIGSKLFREIVKVRFFSKTEEYLRYKSLRVIASRSDAFKVLVGPMIKSIEKRVYQLPFFVKNIPVSEWAGLVFDRLYNPMNKYIEVDYTSYESSFIPEVMEAIEFELYKYMTCNVAPELEELFERATGYPNNMKSRLLSACVESRMSGEMNTSLGNGFSNLVLMMFVLSESGMKADEITGLVEGDDGLFAVPRKVKIRYDLFDKLGFSIKVKEHERIDETSFCSKHFDPFSRTNIADLVKICAKFGWSVGKKYLFAGDKRLAEILRSKSFSLLYEYPCAPVVTSLAKYGLRVTQHVRDPKCKDFDNAYLWGRFKLNSSIKLKMTDVPMSARLLAERLFKISPAKQIAIERMLDAKQDRKPMELNLSVPEDWKNYANRFVHTFDKGTSQGFIGTFFPDCIPLSYENMKDSHYKSG